MSGLRPFFVGSVLVYLLAITTVPSLHAQVMPPAGSRVRITSPELRGGIAHGFLEPSTADSLMFSGERVSRASITRIEVSTGRKSHWLAGVGIGLVLGAGAGVALTCPTYCGDIDNGFVVPLAAATLGGVGMLVGGLIGAATHSEHWSAASLPIVAIQPGIGRQGLAISVGIRL